jgi:von Willebrand factor type A domain
VIAHWARARRFAAPAIAVTLLSAGLLAQGAQKIALVTVVSDNGSRLADLAAKDVVVHEDKAERKVVSVEPATEPMFIALLLDTSAAAAGRQYPVQDLRKAVSNFVKTVTSGQPDTQIAIMTVAGAAVSALDFTTKADEVDRVVQRLFPDQQGGAVMLEALSAASAKFAEKQTPRRVIVTVDFNSPEGGSSSSMKKVAEDVRKSGATVWSVSVRGTGESAATREDLLNAISQASGGLRLSAVEASGLDSMLAKVANSITAQYSVTFARPDASPAKAVKMDTTRGAKILLTPWMR